MIDQPYLTPSAPQRLTLGARLTSPDVNGVERELTRAGIGLGLAALYGLALGARAGGVALVQHAAITSLGLALVGALGLPPLFVVLGLVDAPVSPRAMLSAGARALAGTGFVLAGLAPSAALLSVTIESPHAAACVARAGLALAGGIGLYQLLSSVRGLLGAGAFGTRAKCTAFLGAFCWFACALAGKFWSILPILKGGT